MENMKKHARIYDCEWIPDQDEAREIARERMGERQARLKKQRQNGANQPIVHHWRKYW